jgi:predicted RNA polymerase sigma factor
MAIDIGAGRRRKAHGDPCLEHARQRAGSQRSDEQVHSRANPATAGAHFSGETATRPIALRWGAPADTEQAPALAGHQPCWVARAHLQTLAGSGLAAQAIWQRATGLTGDPRVRTHLLARAAAAGQ